MKIVDIKGYEGLYRISENGRVFARASKYNNKVKEGRLFEVLQSDTHNGYKRVSLRKLGKYKSKKVHRLVMESFVGINNDLQVDHLDGDKHNNNLWNLEYVTPRENTLRAVKLGLKPKNNSVVRKDRKLTNNQVELAKFMLLQEYSYMEIKKASNISSKDLYAIRIGRNYKSIEIPNNLDNTEISKRIKELLPS